jgi:hypothetical protein
MPHGRGRGRRPPSRIEHTTTYYYGGGPHRRKKKLLWLYIGAGVFAMLIMQKAPGLAALIVAGIILVWRKQNGR